MLECTEKVCQYIRKQLLTNILQNTCFVIFIASCPYTLGVCQM